MKFLPAQNRLDRIFVYKAITSTFFLCVFFAVILTGCQKNHSDPSSSNPDTEAQEQNDVLGALAEMNLLEERAAFIEPIVFPDSEFEKNNSNSIMLVYNSKATLQEVTDWYDATLPLHFDNGDVNAGKDPGNYFYDGTWQGQHIIITLMDHFDESSQISLSIFFGGYSENNDLIEKHFSE